MGKQGVVKADQADSFPFDALKKCQISQEDCVKLHDYYNKNKDIFKSQNESMHIKLDTQGIPYSVIQIPKGPRAGIYVITKIEVGSGSYKVAKIAIRLDSGEEALWGSARIDHIKRNEREANSIVSDRPQDFLSGEEVEYKGSWRERKPRYKVDKSEKDLIQRSRKRKKHIIKELGVKKVGILMDYAKGGELRDKVALDTGFSMDTSPAQMKEGCKLMQEYAEKVAALHKKNLIHLDQKPENIFVMADGSLRLGDFGYAEQEGVKCNAKGTPGFMGPQMSQALNKHQTIQVDRKTDIWSMGCCFLDMMGERESKIDWWVLFVTAEQDGTINDYLTLEHLKEQVLPGRLDFRHRDHELHSIIDKCLRINPSVRPTAHDVAIDLKNLNKKLQA